MAKTHMICNDGTETTNRVGTKPQEPSITEVKEDPTVQEPSFLRGATKVWLQDSRMVALSYDMIAALPPPYA